MSRAESDRDFRRLFDEQFVDALRLARFLGAIDPEDVAQEAFARLYARWQELTDKGSADGYLRATVVNLVRSRQRHEAVVRQYEDATTPIDVVASAESAALHVVSGQNLLAALGALSPRHREALVLRFWLNLTERQMANAMGCSVGSVKSHVSRGLSALRAHLGLPTGQGRSDERRGSNE